MFIIQFIYLTHKYLTNSTFVPKPRKIYETFLRNFKMRALKLSRRFRVSAGFLPHLTSRKIGRNFLSVSVIIRSFIQAAEVSAGRIGVNERSFKFLPVELSAGRKFCRVNVLMNRAYVHVSMQSTFYLKLTSFDCIQKSLNKMLVSPFS